MPILYSDWDFHLRVFGKQMVCFGKYPKTIKNSRMHKRGDIVQNLSTSNRFIDRLLYENSVQMKQTA